MSYGRPAQSKAQNEANAKVRSQHQSKDIPIGTSRGKGLVG